MHPRAPVAVLLALAIAGCGQAPGTSDARPSEPSLPDATPIATGAASPVDSRSTETPAPRATPAANTGPGRWVEVKGDLFAPAPLAAMALGGRVVVLDTQPQCYISGGPGEMDPVPEPATAWVFDPDSARFESSGDLDTIRTEFAMASLDDGRVLVAGGWNDEGVPKSSTRIWSADTGEWAEGPLMTIARAAPVAVTLRDGRVLVAGGVDASGNPTARAELYDPATDRWARTGDLPVPNAVHSAVRLASGDVLVVSVTDLDGVPGIVSRYLPEAEMWEPVEDPPRPLGTPVALEDGSALFFDGTRSVLRFDPATGWSDAGTLVAAHGGVAAIALLDDGRVIVAGGIAGDPMKGTAKALRTAEVFDPATGHSTKVSSMPHALADAAAIRLDDGSVLVAGGVSDAFNGDTPWCPAAADAAYRWIP